MGKPSYLYARMKTPGFIKELVRALAECEDVNESTIVSVSHRLWNSPVTADLLTSFVEIGYCDNNLVQKECSRLLAFTDGN